MADPEGVPEEDKVAVKGYNRDDCASTEALRRWLEDLRTEQIAKGATIDRPGAVTVEVSPELDAWQQKVAALAAQLLEGVPDDANERTEAEGAMAACVHAGLARSREESRMVGVFQAEGSFCRGSAARAQRPCGLGICWGARWNGQGTHPSLPVCPTIDIKKRKDTADLHPPAIFTHSFVDTQVLAEAVVRLGEYVASHGIEGNGDYRAGRDLIQAMAPRLRGLPLQQDGESTLATAIRAGLTLDQSIFPLQGAPGAGETFTGARMICALAKDGKRIGITANSHKVIRNLLDEVIKAAGAEKQVIQCAQKVSDDEDDLPILKDNDEFLDALGGAGRVGGATAWFWARPDASLCIDVLFIDEAAQMSLANVLAVSQSAKSIVLLGDPRQLEQPIQGSHPDGAEASALDHILGSHATIPADRGLFLPETWRLHPEICAFNSELFYEGRLFSRPGLERQQIKSPGRLAGRGFAIFRSSIAATRTRRERKPTLCVNS
ncbi:AAA family ATPase [Bradyrhizobium arachidis]|uniref:AAA family ATPase n=1 Tax=Bradyrhizobium arachidis TaxID=858423 RepID=UPI002163C1AF|nr:AAA family ATPase [Bradyrhizobium arachidis]